MLERVLIANRGEIAVRIAKSLKRLGIASVAVYSDADEGAPHTILADAAVHIGPAPASESYLVIDKLLDVAQETGCRAVHPGYGFLSESQEFISRVESAGLTFVGPSASTVALMGDKQEARAFAEKTGVPVVPGLVDALVSDDEAVSFAQRFGYPLLVKAAAGGGGIGMKVAQDDAQLIKALAECRRRSQSAFGQDKLYIERYITDARHVEVQVMGDCHGNVVHLFERECSIQRRHQKVIEESPSVLMGRFPRLRERMTEAAVNLARAASYVNAGTVEFLVDSKGEFYFIEMNTRLQVEHPVTEMITGLDLVEWQIRIAAGEKLPLTQSEIGCRGNAIECRIYAENPEKKFLPAPGRITRYTEPEIEGVRIDSGVRADWSVTPYYDPMLAKVIAHGASREEATARLNAALHAYQIEGITHNGTLHRAILASTEFRSGEFHTGWLEDWFTKEKLDKAG